MPLGDINKVDGDYLFGQEVRYLYGLGSLASGLSIGTTAEGVFPKVTGDKLYPSEVNRFSPKLIGNISQFVAYGASATNFQTIGGSILYPGAGSLQISQFMNVRLNTEFTPILAGQHNHRVVISGTDGLNNYVLYSKNQTTNPGTDISFSFGCDFILTSGTITSNGGNIGSPYTLFFQYSSDVADTIGRAGDFVVIGY